MSTTTGPLLDMSITGKHYHFATGKESKNRGKYYLCQNKTTNAADGCIITPAYRKHNGEDDYRLIVDTTLDYPVLVGMVTLEDNELVHRLLLLSSKEEEEYQISHAQKRLDKYINQERLF